MQAGRVWGQQPARRHDNASPHYPPTLSRASPLTHLRLLPAREGEQSRELIKSLSAARHKPKNSSYISAETLKPWGSLHQPDLFLPHSGHPDAAMGDPKEGGG